MEDSVIFFFSGNGGESPASPADLFLELAPSDDMTRGCDGGLAERTTD